MFKYALHGATYRSSFYRLVLLGAFVVGCLGPLCAYEAHRPKCSLAEQACLLHDAAYRVSTLYASMGSSAPTSEFYETLQQCFELFPDHWEAFQHIYQLSASCKRCTIPHYYDLSELLSLFHRHILGKHVTAEAYYTKFLRLGIGGKWIDTEGSWAMQSYLKRLVDEDLQLSVKVLSRETTQDVESFWCFLCDTPSLSYNTCLHQSLYGSLKTLHPDMLLQMEAGYNNPVRMLCRKLRRDFSNLWTVKMLDFGAEGIRSRPEPIGYIGEDFQRFRIHFLHVWRDQEDLSVYHVKGKVKMQDHVYPFEGEMQIDHVQEHTTIGGYEDNFAFQYELYIDIECRLVGDLQGSYTFRVFQPDPSKRIGVLKGGFESSFLIDRDGQVKYNVFGNHSDSYCNNQFSGVWLPQGSTVGQVCNWGDYRIPNTKGPGPDMGAGFFSPDDSFLDKGWQTYRDVFVHGRCDDIQALEAEIGKWWE